MGNTMGKILTYIGDIRDSHVRTGTIYIATCNNCIRKSWMYRMMFWNTLS